MTVTMFLMLLSAFCVLTSVCTEGVKKFLDGMNKKYASNVIVLIMALLIGIGGTAIFYIFMNIPFTVVNVICMVLMGCANWLGAMGLYDKVVQSITQLTSVNNKQ